MGTAPTSESKRQPLLDETFMRRLEQLQIVSRKIFAGKFKGERLSRRKGQSVEFADYKNYTIGDDLRFLDWNIYGRLDRLFIKLFLEEEDLDVSLLIDCSTSMDWGEPNKSWYARRLAAGLAYIALSNYRVEQLRPGEPLRDQQRDRYGPDAPAQPQPDAQDPGLPGRAEGRGRQRPGEIGSAKRFAVQHRRKGVVVLLSDFFDKAGIEEPMRYLLATGADIYALQVLSPWELQPDLAGDLKLIDVEDGDAAEVTITQALLQKYKSTLNAFCRSLHEFCSARGITYLLTSTDVPAERLILNYLRTRGLIR